MLDTNTFLRPDTVQDMNDFIRAAEEMLDAIELEEDAIGNKLRNEATVIQKEAFNMDNSSTTVMVVNNLYGGSDDKHYYVVLWMQGRVNDVRWSPRVRQDIKDKIEEKNPTIILSGPLRGVWAFFERIPRKDFVQYQETDHRVGIDRPEATGERSAKTIRRTISIGSVTISQVTSGTQRFNGASLS